MMITLLNFLKGKKTQIVVAIAFIAGGLMACGVEIPKWVLVMLGSSGLGFLRAGVQKSQVSSEEAAKVAEKK